MEKRRKSIKLIDKATFNKKKSMNNSKFSKVLNNFFIKIKFVFLKIIDDYLKKKKVNPQSAFDYLVYGIRCSRVYDGKMILGVVMLSENLKHVIYFLDTKTWRRTKIDTLQTTQISFDKSRGEFIKLKDQSQLWSGTYMSLQSQTESYDLVFHLPEELDLFLRGIRLVLEDEATEEDPLKENIKKIWIIYDNDFSGKMEYKEFTKFVKDLNIKLENKSIDELFNLIDIDKSGEIDFNEFVEWFKKFSSGSEFNELFSQYTKGKEFLSPQDLRDFFTVEQNEIVSTNEAAIIILQFKQDVSKEAVENLSRKLQEVNKKDRNADLTFDEEEANLLKLHLNEFKVLLYDKNFTNVIDTDRLMTMQDMSRPMYQYFINSSHNTYLSGHQLYGSSSVEMYNYALLKGYRLVELDCWDGDEENGPVVTHGYTFTSKIYLKDVLQAIRKSAFVASEYPVILSIENHCNKKQQDVMADLFKKCLMDLYIINPENPPLNYPSPEELKNTFIIKCSRPRIYRKLVTPTNKQNSIAGPYNSNDKDNVSSNTGGTAKRKSLAAFLKKKKSLNPTSPKKGGTNSMFLKTIASSISKEANDGNKKKDNTKVVEIESMLQGYMFKNVTETETKAEKEYDIKKSKKNSEDTVGILAESCGMLGTKLHLDKLKECNYQYWDCVTVTEKKMLSFYKDPLNQIKFMNFNRTSFAKAYPLRMDSTNLDPTKAWIAGMQIAAINCQSLLDDFTLLNFIFFQMNNNAGYILKPEKMNEPDFVDNYEMPVGTVTLKLISATNLNLLFPHSVQESFELSITTNLIGSYTDDENNKLYSTKINNNLLNPLFKNEMYDFKVYEFDLSFILIKISNKEKVIARSVIPLPVMASGIRTAPLYDNLCREFRDSTLVFHITKKFGNEKKPEETKQDFVTETKEK
jgi:phosphatidylinositol phospholipase C beta